MKMKINRPPFSIFLLKDTWGSEVSLSLFAGVWGFWLLLPIDTFGSSHIFTAMSQIAPEAVWGAANLCFGLLSGIVPLLEIFGRVELRIRFYFALVHVAAWIFILVMFIQSNINSTATAVYSVLTVESMAVSISLAARMAQENA